MASACGEPVVLYRILFSCLWLTEPSVCTAACVVGFVCLACSLCKRILVLWSAAVPPWTGDREGQWMDRRSARGRVRASWTTAGVVDFERRARPAGCLGALWGMHEEDMCPAHRQELIVRRRR